MTSFTYFEPLTDGHCTFWAEIVLRHAAQDKRLSKLALVTSPGMAERLHDVCRDHSVQVSVLTSAQLSAMTQGGLWSRGRAQWAAAKAIRERTDGHVFLPFFDQAVASAAADFSRQSGRGTISGIIFRPPNSFGLKPGFRFVADGSRRWATYIAARKGAVSKLFTLDERAPEAAIGRLSKALCYVPDPAPDLALLAGLAPSPRPDGRSVYVLFGSLTARKGIFQMLEAWAQMDRQFLASNVLRLVGRLGKDDRALFIAQLARVRANCPHAVIELEDSFVSDIELAQEVVSAAVILAPYQSHIGSSGVLYWAAAAGRPVLAQNTGLMGYQVSRYRLGIAIDCTDAHMIAAALKRPVIAQADRAFYAAHLPQVFAQTLIDGITG